MTYLYSLIGVLVLGCGGSSFAPCSVRCGDGTACPSSLTCGADGYCHADDDCATCFAGACSTIDANPENPTGLRLVEHGIRTMGASALVGDRQLVRQGLESTPRSCNGTLCVRGGIVP